MIRIAIVLIAFISIVLFAFLYWAHLGNSKHETLIEGFCTLKEKPEILKIISYNIAYGRGPQDDKGDLRDKKIIENYLNNISDFLRKQNADIVLLQEVDLDSKRTSHINEINYIAKKAEFPCYTCVTTWIKNYVPYPIFNFKQHYGRMKSGQCILSKFPILNAMRISLPQRSADPWYHIPFYLNRAIQIADLKIGNEIIKIINVHLEAYDRKNRQTQAKILANIIDEFKKEKIIVGGDFNALPPNATKKKDFPDINHKDWKDVTNDTTMNVFFFENFPLNEAVKNVPENKTFTFPSKDPTRKLDYIFYSNDFKKIDSKVFSNELNSDHLPMILELRSN